jgi:threonine/homoserine/homoserine lactone efflux protein
MKPLFVGMIMGIAGAVPLGPINIEMIRRSIKYGFISGVAIGIGASFADLTYLCFISSCIFTFINKPIILKWIGIIGSIIVAFFGVRILKEKNKKQILNDIPQNDKNFFKQSLEGYLIALINPFIIVFWFSLSSQIAVITNNSLLPILYAGFGVMISMICWTFTLSFVSSITRKKVSDRWISRVNVIGGITLLGLAVFGLVRSLYYF